MRSYQAIIERYILDHGDALESLGQTAFGVLSSLYDLAEALTVRDDALAHEMRKHDSARALLHGRDFGELL